MITLEVFKSLLSRSESETLDFKRDNYDLSNEEKKIDLVKDVICMANTPRKEDSYIILGVKRLANGENELSGIKRDLDDADIQLLLKSKVNPPPAFNYEVLEYEDLRFGVLKILPSRLGPCVPINDLAEKLRKGQVYFRRGSMNDLAQSEDLHRIIAWINNGSAATATSEGSFPSWEGFLSAMQSFDHSRRYLLVTSPLEDTVIGNLGAIGKGNWSAVFDLDPESDTTGLLKAAEPLLSEQRSLRLAVKGDQQTLHPDRATYWFFARGLSGRAETVELGAWKEWKQPAGPGSAPPPPPAGPMPAAPANRWDRCPGI